MNKINIEYKDTAIFYYENENKWVCNEYNIIEESLFRVKREIDNISTNKRSMRLGAVYYLDYYDNVREGILWDTHQSNNMVKIYDKQLTKFYNININFVYKISDDNKFIIKNLSQIKKEIDILKERYSFTVKQLEKIKGIVNE